MVQTVMIAYEFFFFRMMTELQYIEDSDPVE